MKQLNFSTAILAAFVLAAAFGLGAERANAQEEIYKWVDADGVTHFSARPPEGIEYQSINTHTEAVRNMSPQTVGETEELGDDPQESTVLPELPEVDVQQPDPELVAERCQQARENLMWMTQRVRINRENDAGEVERISEEERQRLIGETQAFIDEWC